MANRLLHLDFAPSVAEWLDGMATGFAAGGTGRVSEPDAARLAIIYAEVTGFIKHRPALLHRYPTDHEHTGHAWPSHRTWHMAANVLAHLDPAETNTNLLAVAGLVGLGPASEFITWRTEQDLPDPNAVTAAPESVDWSDLSIDRAWAILTGVVTYATNKGTTVAWREAWAPLAYAADHGKGDVAAATAQTLLKARPVNAKVPATVKKFAGVLTDAGLMAA